VRTIQAPDDRLKELQIALKEVLEKCNSEISPSPEVPKGIRPSIPKSLSHGFEKHRSIVTNAWAHKNRRFVLNLDIADFFPSINFGRVRGFFMKNRGYALHERVATVIAQIACFNNELPQGSPCSPIISNLVAHLLDVRLANLAKQTRCTYTRYADDLTFSTNQREFPVELAREDASTPGRWSLMPR
jgi:RNA-directed DNA polymerase